MRVLKNYKRVAGTKTAKLENTQEEQPNWYCYDLCYYSSDGIIEIDILFWNALEIVSVKFDIKN